MSVIAAWIAETQPHLSIVMIKDLCLPMFKGNTPCFSNFHQLYSILPRGAWDEKEKKYVVSQKEYIQDVFKQYMESEHGNNKSIGI